MTIKILRARVAIALACTATLVGCSSGDSHETELQEPTISVGEQDGLPFVLEVGKTYTARVQVTTSRPTVAEEVTGEMYVTLGLTMPDYNDPLCGRSAQPPVGQTSITLECEFRPKLENRGPIHFAVDGADSLFSSEATTEPKRTFDHQVVTKE